MLASFTKGIVPTFLQSSFVGKAVCCPLVNSVAATQQVEAMHRCDLCGREGQLATKMHIPRAIVCGQ